MMSKNDYRRRVSRRRRSRFSRHLPTFIVLFVLTVLIGGCIFAVSRFLFHKKSGPPKDTEVIAAAAEYLKAYAIDCLLVSFLFCIMGYFNGCGRTTFVMIQGIVGAFFVRIPVSWIMSRVQPVSLFGVGLATPASTVVQLLLCAVYFIWLRHREKKVPAVPFVVE